jgi:hypothetical protein
MSIGERQQGITHNEKVLKMLKMAYDKLQILAGTSLPFFISFNTVLCSRCGQVSRNFHTKHGKTFNYFFRGGNLIHSFNNI